MYKILDNQNQVLNGFVHNVNDTASIPKLALSGFTVKMGSDF